LTDPRTVVVITGATGFIGQGLQRALLGGGHKLRALVRPESSHRHRLLAGCEALPVDLTDLDGLKQALADARAVIYCAGIVRGRKAADFDAAHVAGVRTMLSALLSSEKPPPFLLISSLAAGRPELSHYSRSKRAGEQALAEQGEIPWTIIRPPAVYGPGDKEMLGLLKLAMRGIVIKFGSSGQRFSLLHTDDLAMAVIAWLRSWPRCRQQVYSIDDGTAGGYDARAIADAAGSGRYFPVRIPKFVLHSIAGINVLFSALLGYAPMLTPGKVREICQQDWLCDNSAFTLATAWSPSIGLREGLRGLFDPAA
jgi:nucleoside-diphosphate-sugar epimerase